jgi:opacity protein-like surface antigen
MKMVFVLLFWLLFIWTFVPISYAQEEKPFEFSFYGGWVDGPYGVEGGDSQYGVGAGLDVPLLKRDAYSNMLSGQFFFSWSHGEKDYNLNIVDMRTNDILGKEPLTANLQTISLNANLKYTFRNLISVIPLDPYILAGLGIYIYEVDYDDVGEDDHLPANLLYVGTPNGLAGPLYSKADMPFGWVHTDFGFQVGGGLDYYICPSLSLGLDYRYNIITSEVDNNFHQLFSKISFHF